MVKRLFAGFLIFSLMGTGCLGFGNQEIPPYIPGETPTDEQLEVMTDEEKKLGMEAMMEDHPMEEITKEEQVKEVKLSIEHMKEGDTIRFGDFEGRFLHPAAGSVRIVEEGGKKMLVFSEDFSVLMGPALYVYLSSETSPQKAGAVMDEGFEIAKLKSSKGVQTYELPDGINFGDEGATSSRAAIHSVVIVCKPFKFIFASAGF